MKKLLTLSNQLSDRLAQLAKEQSTTQSRIVETALTIYIMLNYGSPKQAKNLSDMKLSNNNWLGRLTTSFALYPSIVYQNKIKHS